MFIQICRLKENPSFAKSICCNALHYAQQYDEKSIFKKWKTLIDNLKFE